MYAWPSSRRALRIEADHATTATAWERVTDDVFSELELRTLAGFLGGYSGLTRDRLRRCAGRPAFGQRFRRAVARVRRRRRLIANADFNQPEVQVDSVKVGLTTALREIAHLEHLEDAVVIASHRSTASASTR